MTDCWVIDVGSYCFHGSVRSTAPSMCYDSLAWYGRDPLPGCPWCFLTAKKAMFYTCCTHTTQSYHISIRYTEMIQICTGRSYILYYIIPVNATIKLGSFPIGCELRVVFSTSVLRVLVLSRLFVGIDGFLKADIGQNSPLLSCACDKFVTYSCMCMHINYAWICTCVHVHAQDTTHIQNMHAIVVSHAPFWYFGCWAGVHFKCL